MDPVSIADEVREFYQRHPYPPPVENLDRYRERWNDTQRRRADFHLFEPAKPYRDDRTILVAGCGTSQAAKYAVRWPNAKITGIEISRTSIEQTERLKREFKLDNLEVLELPVERATELDCRFDHVVCTGVLHHLPNPDKGLEALRNVLNPEGSLHLMVYAPYGRAGIYLLQDYCRRLGIGTSTKEIRDLATSLGALPPDHPLVPLLRNSPDFQNEAALADALLHPQDRSYSVPIPSRRLRTSIATANVGTIRSAGAPTSIFLNRPNLIATIEQSSSPAAVRPKQPSTPCVGQMRK